LLGSLGRISAPSAGTDIEETVRMETNLIPNDPQGAIRFFEEKIHFTTGPAELAHALANGRKAGVDFNLIDLRSISDYARGHLPGAVHLPEEDWSTLSGLSSERLNILYGESPASLRAARAALEFATAGFSVMELVGGYLAWAEQGFQIESAPGLGGAIPGLSTSNPFDEGRYSTEALL
jgi:rhodanese-related sulfurtransferase